ncbi:MAG: hypothetical protein NW241_00705 [Bacteroidia bacterium]|nr:hypothetical protein [Bacteroidia bacterium]
MSYEAFQQQYEAESGDAFAELRRLDETALLALIAARRWGRYDLWKGEDHYQIWRALETKGTSASIWPLFAIVSDLQHAYLVRYHACEALFGIAGIRDGDLKGRVQYGLDLNRQPADRQEALAKLEALLRSAAGPGTARTPKPWWKIW